MGLGVAVLVLQRLQPLLERVKLGLLAIHLVRTRAQRAAQRQQDKNVFAVHPDELTGSGRSYSNLTRDSPVISGGCARPIIFSRVGLMSSSAPVSASVACCRPT